MLVRSPRVIRGSRGPFEISRVRGQSRLWPDGISRWKTPGWLHRKYCNSYFRVVQIERNLRGRIAGHKKDMVCLVTIMRGTSQ